MIVSRLENLVLAFGSNGTCILDILGSSFSEGGIGFFDSAVGGGRTIDEDGVSGGGRAQSVLGVAGG